MPLVPQFKPAVLYTTLPHVGFDLVWTGSILSHGVVIIAIGQSTVFARIHCSSPCSLPPQARSTGVVMNRVDECYSTTGVLVGDSR